MKHSASFPIPSATVSLPPSLPPSVSPFSLLRGITRECPSSFSSSFVAAAHGKIGLRDENEGGREGQRETGREGGFGFFCRRSTGRELSASGDVGLSISLPSPPFLRRARATPSPALPRLLSPLSHFPLRKWGQREKKQTSQQTNKEANEHVGARQEFATSTGRPTTSQLLLPQT